MPCPCCDPYTPEMSPCCDPYTPEMRRAYAQNGCFPPPPPPECKVRRTPNVTPPPKPEMSLTEIVKVVMPLFAAGFSYELAKKTQQRRDAAQQSNYALQTQRMMLAGEALAVAAELGASTATIGRYIQSYRDAAAVVVADEEIPGDAEAEAEIEETIAAVDAGAVSPPYVPPAGQPLPGASS